MGITAVLVVVLVWAGSVAGALVYGIGLGEDRGTAREARDKEVVRIASVAAAASTAEAISRLDVKHTTIRQTLEREVHEKTVFRDCRSGDLARLLFNSGVSPAGQGVDPGELPASHPAR